MPKNPCARGALCAADGSSTFRPGNSVCRTCEAADARARRKRDKPTEPLAFDADVANVPDRGGRDKAERKAASEGKRQEFNRLMGQTLQDVHDVAAGTREQLSPETFDYLAKLSESEAAFGNRRIARSTAISLAHELLGIRMFRAAADAYFSDKVAPAGYAARKKAPPAVGELDRTIFAVLSDLHLGADLSGVDNPEPFRRTEEARRLAHIVAQVLDYKRQYRDRTRCALLLNGDLIDGMLLHDLRDGAPLTEQMAIFWHLLSQAIERLAAEFPRVDVYCQAGNHGRDKLRHPGRATSSKWDGHEWRMMYALSRMFTAVPNVHFDLPFRAVSVIDVYGQKLALTHGDTEVPLGNPTTQHDRNVAAFQKIAASRILDCEPEAWVVGHFHSAMICPGRPTVVYNGMLVPPNGHARTMGYIDKPTGQWIFEAVKGHVVGDSRFVTVGREQDRDATLDAVLSPLQFKEIHE